MEDTSHTREGLMNHLSEAANMVDSREEGIRGFAQHSTDPLLMKTQYIPHLFLQTIQILIRETASSDLGKASTEGTLLSI